MQMQTDDSSKSKVVAGSEIGDITQSRPVPYSWSSYLSSSPIQFRIPDYGKETCSAPHLKQESFAGLSMPDVEKGFHEAQLGKSNNKKLIETKTDRP